MKKFLGIILLAVAVILLAGGLAWMSRASVASMALSRNLEVPVRIESLDLSRTNATLQGFAIGNPPQYYGHTAFSARLISITSSLSQLRATPLVIDEIIMMDLLINLEHTRNSSSTNWSEILKHKKATKSGRPYLIRRLVLRNLTVQTTSPTGQIKRYPTIDYMEFQNISDETGFPISEIQKAIFDRVMQDVFKKFEDIQKIFKPFIPGSGIPFFN